MKPSENVQMVKLDRICCLRNSEWRIVSSSILVFEAILVSECESLYLWVGNLSTWRIWPRRSSCPKPKKGRNRLLSVRAAETESG